MLYAVAAAPASCLSGENASGSPYVPRGTNDRSQVSAIPDVDLLLFRARPLDIARRCALAAQSAAAQCRRRLAKWRKNVASCGVFLSHIYINPPRINDRTDLDRRHGECVRHDRQRAGLLLSDFSADLALTERSRLRSRLCGAFPVCSREPVRRAAARGPARRTRPRTLKRSQDRRGVNRCKRFSESHWRAVRFLHARLPDYINPLLATRRPRCC